MFFLVSSWLIQIQNIMIGKGSEKKHPVKLCNQANFFCRAHNAILNQEVLL